MAGAEVGRGLAVIVPSYQAVATVGAVVARTRATLPDAAIYVVDDGSRDGTGAAAAPAGATVITHDRNRGKGAALASGIARAVTDGAILLATIDADGQHPAEMLPRLIGPLRRQEADLVLGARERGGAMPLGRRVTNWLSATVASRLGGIRVPDAQTGLRAFTRRLATAVQPVVATYRGYDYEAAFLLAALRGGFVVASVDVPTIYNGAPSHFRHWGDGWRVARVFARYLRGAA